MFVQACARVCEHVWYAKLVKRGPGLVPYMSDDEGMLYVLHACAHTDASADVGSHELHMKLRSGSSRTRGAGGVLPWWDGRHVLQSEA